MKAFLPWTIGLTIGLFGVPIAASSQSITPATDGTGTVVDATGNRYDISEGTQAGSNLFHSFEQLGLSQGEIANFLSSPDIENILGRVTGGDASFIDGLLQVTGGDSNLFLMNPAGIIFGENARLNVPADFSATTANAIGIGQDWFRSIGSNDYSSLSGTPESFAFTTALPGAIVNTGNLSADAGQQIQLVGGLVINTGTLSTPGGEITIEAVPEEGLVTVTQERNLLSFGLPIATKSDINGSQIPTVPQTLPQILSRAEASNVDGISVDGDVVRLTRSDQIIFADSGATIISGTLDTSSSSIGSGGTINALGRQVALVNVAVEASENDSSIIVESADGIIVDATENNELNLSSNNVTFRANTDRDTEGDFIVIPNDEGQRAPVSTNEGDIVISGVNIIAGDIRTNDAVSGFSNSDVGDIEIQGSGYVEVGNINSGRTISLTASEDITVKTIIAVNDSFSGPSPSIDINAGGFFRATQTVPSTTRIFPEDSGSELAYYNDQSSIIFGINETENIRISHGSESFSIGPDYEYSDENRIYRNSANGEQVFLNRNNIFVNSEGLRVSDGNGFNGEVEVVALPLRLVDSDASFTAGTISFTDGDGTIRTSESDRVIDYTDTNDLELGNITSTFLPAGPDDSTESGNPGFREPQLSNDAYSLTNEKLSVEFSLCSVFDEDLRAVNSSSTEPEPACQTNYSDSNLLTISEDFTQ